MRRTFGLGSESGQRESGDFVGAGALAPETAGDDRRDILLALHAVRHRRSIKRSGKFGAPQFLARLHVESAQPLVIRGAYENQAAAGNDGTADIWPACVGISEAIGDTQYGLPCD